MKSTKAFAFEYVDGMPKLRTMVSPAEVKYNPELHFQWFEESDFLVEALNGIPYATFKTDNTDEMSDLLQNGFVDKDKQIWTAFFAYWKDQEGHAFLAPKAAKVTLRTLGVRAEMKSNADILKFDKYCNRLFAALPKKLYGGSDPAWGTEVEWNEEEQYALIQLNPHDDLSEEDCLISIKYVDLKTLNEEQKALVDGCIAINEKATRALGLSNQPRLGMAWRGTFGTSRGLGKGHIKYVPHLSHDVVIYGPKTILKTEKFFFGSMGPLHAGDPHTDIQAFVNFHFHRPGLAVDLAKEYMREVIAASKDEDKLRRLFMRHTDTRRIETDQEAWVLRRALEFGVSFLRFPGLYRRVVRYLMKKVMACDSRARIPMQSDSYSKALYAYVLPEDPCIGTEGEVLPQRGINKGTIVVPDLKPGTRVICYRQPSENSNAWVSLTVVSRPGYEKYAGRGICMLGQGAHDVLSRLGGGDMDDQFVIVHDPVWVEAFHTMRPYPETEKISAETSPEEQSLYDQDQAMLDNFTDELLHDVQSNRLDDYTHKHVQLQMDMASKQRAGIGPVVNFGIDDMLKSDPDHQKSMLADLKKHPEAADWLADERTPWQAAKYMTNLEIVIDGNVKDATLLNKLGDVAGTIKAYHKAQRVYPACFAGNALAVANGQITEDKLKSRIPRLVAISGQFVVARSLTCRALEAINALSQRLNDVFIEREWALVDTADRAFRPHGAPANTQPYGREAELVKLVRGIWRKDETGEWINQDPDQPILMDMWNTLWRKEMEQTERSHDGAYERICKQMASILPMDDANLMERIAVEIYYQTYKKSEPNGPKVDPVTSKFRNYPDGLLWSPLFGNHFINALRAERLSGYYTVVELRPEYARRLMNKSVSVQVRSHNVFIQDSEDNFTVWVGYIAPKSSTGTMLPNGTFRMDSGLIEYRKSQPICQPSEDYLIPAQALLTRLYPKKDQSVIEQDVATKEVRPTSAFGKLLNKALTILK